MNLELLIENLPALLIVIPLIAGPFCIMLRNGFAAWVIAIICHLLVLAIAIALYYQVSDGYTIRYALGGWAAPTGIEYYIDVLNASLLLLIALISLITVLYSKATVAREIIASRHYLFYTGWMLCLTGLMGIVITGDAFNVFVFLEVSSLSMYMLIALGHERKQALMAAFRYLIMGSIGASFILIGIGFLYAATGTLNMIDLSERIPAVADSRTVLVAFSFITVGLLVKAAVFPVFSWLPSAYQYAPSAVSAFLSGTATKVSVYILLRFFFQIFGVDYSFEQLLLDELLLPLAAIGFVVMSVVAIFQTDIRRVLAYSSIAQLGYIIAGLSMVTHEGVTASIIHMINHGIIKAALFMAVGCIAYRIGSTHIASMGNLIRTMPWTSSAFIIASLGLVGVPLTSGFISKWHLVSAAIDSGWWLMAAMMLLSSLMAIIYLGKIIEAFYFGPANHNNSDTPVTEAPLSMLMPLWLLIGVIVYTGIDASIVVDTASYAATQLFEGFVVSNSEASL